MPIYEYRCQDCHHEFERMQKFSDPPIAACPTCAGSVQKLISRSAFHLKGSGWYVTDYAKNAGQKSDSPEKSSSEKTTSEKSTPDKSDSNSASSDSSSGSGSESTTKKSPSGTAAA
jgi:putative FmdB family regulatory protein